MLFYYKRDSLRKNRDFSLSEEEFKELTSQICFYCGAQPSQKCRSGTWGEYLYNGIDRKDNSVGYILNNCVPCCKTCNYAKHTTPFVDFVAYIDRVRAFRPII